MAKVRRKGGTPPRHHQGNPNRDTAPPGSGVIEKRKKPYGFAATPPDFSSKEPIWHDGSSSRGKVSGELRCELETLTPMLVGWERQVAAPREPSHDPCAIDPARVQTSGDEITIELAGHDPITTAQGKSLLCPMRAPWGERPVLIPGDSLKGLLRHELGALLGAPMERVEERSYSYRPNVAFPAKGRRLVLEPRLARVHSRGSIDLDGRAYPVPHEVEVFNLATRDEQNYYPRRRGGQPEEGPAEAASYRGGMGGGREFPAECLPAQARRTMIHTRVDVSSLRVEKAADIPAPVLGQYRQTLKHLLDTDHGHFSGRHPNIRNVEGRRLATSAVNTAAHEEAFQIGDIIWVEWDPARKQVVSFGWHYYYRWAYQDTVRTRGLKATARVELAPTDEEYVDPRSAAPHIPPRGLTSVRRLFGYTGDSDGSKSIGKGHHSQLMGRISINAAIEVVRGAERDRFLPPTFLRELGQPKPSAVEHYIKQKELRELRPHDEAELATYGDAAGYDRSGELAGRKLYLDRADAYPDHVDFKDAKAWEDKGQENRRNDRSTLAIEASRPRSRFRFTLRFQHLEPGELAAVLLALCPNQFAKQVGGRDEYCSKLGYARPLGWGSVQIRTAELHLLPEGSEDQPPQLTPKDVTEWFTAHRKEIDTKLLAMWLSLHRRNHEDAGDYPRSAKDGQIFSYHTELRAEHAKKRRHAATNQTGRK